MPIPAAMAPIIAAGASAAAQTGNALLQSGQNKKARKWQEHMYKWQRADALADWHMMNEYNSPAAQMARFRAAGLNPNLIYGQMSEGATVRSSDSGSWSPKAPEFDASSIIGAYQSVKMQQAQMDMLSKQNALIDYEMEVKRQQALNLAQDTVGKDLSNRYSTGTLQERISLAAADLQFRQGSIEKQAADTQYTISSNRRAEELQPGNVKMQLLDMAESRARTSNLYAQRDQTRQNISWQQKLNPLEQSRKIHELAALRKQIENASKDGTLKDFEIKMNENGFTKNDPAYQRWLGQLFDILKNPMPSEEQQKKNIEGFLRSIKK